MNSRGIARPEIGKLSTARWVCAPYIASAGTFSSPMLSRSMRNWLMQCLLLGGNAHYSARRPTAPGTAPGRMVECAAAPTASPMLVNLLYVGAALLLVLLNGFFVAAEFALVKLRHTQATALAASHGWRGRLLINVHERLDAYLSACQLGITLASLGLGWIGEP